MFSNKIMYAMLAIMLALPMLFGLTSCAEKDNGVTLLPADIIGQWYAENDTPGEVDADGVKVKYQKVVQYGNLRENGTGFWSIIFVDDIGHAIDIPGYFCGGSVDYSINGNRIHFKMKSAGIPILKDSWDVEYNDGTLYVRTSVTDHALKPITPEQDEILQWWLQELGLGASAVYYNINDQDFTADNWRDQEAIYIYDGKSTDYKDEKGRTGYQLVNLPWYEGDKESNLPDGFCDDILPENGWEWAINRCGYRSNMVNNNFFALYNKYTGILRFFYYQPQDFITGNDHCWQVDLNGTVSDLAVLNYGLPSQESWVNKTLVNPAVSSSENSFMEYVTPWVSSLSMDGHITPNVGWWVFDVDLSLYRPDNILEGSNIKLQMRTWESRTVSLMSDVDGSLDGTIKADLELEKAPVSAKSSGKGGGIFGKVKSIYNTGKKVYSIGKGVKETVEAAQSGKVGKAIKTGISTGKDGVALATHKNSSKGGESADPKTKLDGTITLGLDATSKTEGIFSGSVAASGIASPTLYLKDFYSTSHVGQGVWNLKHHPVVYLTHNQIDPDYELNGHYCGIVYSFLDPSSIEVEVNPEIFPEDKIEWMQVEAYRGVRGSMAWEGTDAYRQALGLASREFKMIPWGRFDNYYVNIMNYSDDKADLISSCRLPDHKSGNKIDSDELLETIWGSGVQENDEVQYVLEPNLVQELFIDDRFWGKSFLHFAAEEVNVVLIIKMKDNDVPFIYTRMYLPEFKLYESAADGKAMLDRIDRGTYLHPKTKGHREWNDVMVNRLLEFLRNNNIAMEIGENYSVTDGTQNDRTEGCYKLIDGDEKTKWCTSHKRNGIFFVEFQSKDLMCPQGYYLITGNDTKTYPERNPKSWKLLAKRNPDDEWTTISEVKDYSLPAENLALKEFKLDVEYRYWQYFRFEVSEICWGGVMQLSELKFK